jgi:hypothetical protein
MNFTHLSLFGSHGQHCLSEKWFPEIGLEWLIRKWVTVIGACDFSRILDLELNRVISKEARCAVGVERLNEDIAKVVASGHQFLPVGRQANLRRLAEIIEAGLHEFACSGQILRRHLLKAGIDVPYAVLLKWANL